ncbi:hypothetical protein [Arthrobacter sp. QXT-31]|uniref:hypothetical protein n=1 Tax=Arthrobacter sp. QXT-31 TaxID=1357915 RepID=UPI000971AB74|nr:hypothetical protein [Arthrobacter sp. QXT-31]APX02415.1 hypothetical protein BWQ92_12495 [Arthrobacter sp. QXT-31]
MVISLRRVVRSQYFPAAASRSRPPLGTLAWLLFVYGSVVLSVAVGLWAAIDLARRLSRRRRRPPGRWKGRRRAN